MAIDALGARRDKHRKASGSNVSTPAPQEPTESREALREDIERHIRSLALPTSPSSGQHLNKDRIRLSHAFQRDEVARRGYPRLAKRWTELLDHFADGREVEPTRIEPTLIKVSADTLESDLFRMATLLWSVPVSNGYGRRLRYLVVDKFNGKLIGIFALGDPVFNLRSRDDWIGWTPDARRSRLVNVMDAYVVGAVPPYSALLGGKLVVSLIGSREVSTDFRERYGTSRGIISDIAKDAKLALVTVTSALGRSSIYNRLRLKDPIDEGRSLVALELLGRTRGYGHFQLSDELFERLREVVRAIGHRYANGHKYGNGPNWRMRLIRVGLAEIGLDPELLHHGISREIYALELSDDARAYLRGDIDELAIARPTVREIAEAARKRWIVPRSERMPEFRDIDRPDVEARLRRWSPLPGPSEPLGLRLDRAEKLGIA
jgi:hypothetical protein